MTKVRPIPEGYHSITPYLNCRDASRAIEFYKKALGARERFRMDGPDGRVAHAELEIGDSVLMLSDEHPEMGGKSPQSLGGTPVSLLLYVEDVDTVAKRATEAGMKTRREVANQFYGDRLGMFEDPFGHIWSIATHVEDLTPEEIGRRAKELFGSK